ncbi:hypothetical protein, partial [Wolbachia endosymbiont of Tettigetta isshikii]|uniref:hypothetical protein n=1 Tax=Wolbachia endosymbiont of Tettigetta isshikii TaxID=3239093 RepID=UPI00397EFEDB
DVKAKNDKSCVNREVHAQFCEGLVGKFHRSTRPPANYLLIAMFVQLCTPCAGMKGRRVLK